MAEKAQSEKVQTLYCPACREAVDHPLVCGDCAAVICWRCGMPLEEVDEMGIG
jgi:hypothetical protein